MGWAAKNIIFYNIFGVPRRNVLYSSPWEAYRNLLLNPWKSIYLVGPRNWTLKFSLYIIASNSLYNYSYISYDRPQKWKISWKYLYFSEIFSLIFQIKITINNNQSKQQISEKLPQISRLRPIVKFCSGPRKMEPQTFGGHLHPKNPALIPAKLYRDFSST